MVHDTDCYSICSMISMETENYLQFAIYSSSTEKLNRTHVITTRAYICTNRQQPHKSPSCHWQGDTTAKDESRASASSCPPVCVSSIRATLISAWDSVFSPAKPASWRSTNTYVLRRNFISSHGRCSQHDQPIPSTAASRPSFVL
jgi:hypothetical protein